MSSNKNVNHSGIPLMEARKSRSGSALNSAALFPECR
jgi:hypothetical protein